MAIPKIIHYCWLSGDTIPNTYQRCMDTWKTKLPYYELMLWTAQNFDISSTIWTKQSFEVGLYACASDYIRLYAVYNYGGIYLDMDMEVIKSFDELLDSDLMLAYENHINENIEAGCFGASIEHPYIKKCMEYFENRDFYDPALRDTVLHLEKSDRHEFINPMISPEIMLNALTKYGIPVTIYPRNYFTARNVITGVIEKNERTFTIHNFASLYHPEEWRKGRETEQRISTKFGEKTISAKIFVWLFRIWVRFRRDGIMVMLRHYYKKYFVKKCLKFEK